MSDNTKIKGITPDGKVVEINGDEWEKALEAKQADEPIEHKKKFKPTAKRSRKFCLTSYIDPESLEGYICSLPWVQHWAMATHDRDVDNEGKLKEKHTHILLYTYDAKTASAILKNFDRFSNMLYQGTETPPQNTRVQILHDVVHQWRYLLHLDETDPNQYHYEPDVRICDDFSYWHNLELSETLTASDSNKALAMFDDYLLKVPTRTMLERYGNAFLYHIQHLEKAKECHYRDIGLYAEQGADNLIRIAIEGSGYSEQQKQIFFSMLNYVEEQSFILYSESLRLGLVEPTKKRKELKK